MEKEETLGEARHVVNLWEMKEAAGKSEKGGKE